MLNFSKLVPQLDGLPIGISHEEISQKVQLATETFCEASNETKQFQDRLLECESNSFWHLASPIEWIDSIVPLPPNNYDHAVVAVDGSQIMPTHHEVHSCYLINIGKVVIAYGKPVPVILESTPHLYHGDEDLFPRIDKRRWHADEQYVSLERNLLELSTLRDSCLEVAKQTNLPVVAFVDGSLTNWQLKAMPEPYQDLYRQRVIPIFDSFQSHSIPVLGYISQSRSVDIINLLRIWKCPFEYINCQSNCGHLMEDEYPCSKLWPVNDRQLMKQLLPPMHRGPLFAAPTARCQGLPRAHHICFTHVNVGKEIARIEFPHWLISNIPLLHRALETAILQAEKGPGYPIALAEAHNQAVIRGTDRSSFFELVANYLVELGVPRVRVSPKEAGKRRGIV